MAGNPFHPRKASSVSLAVTAASGVVALLNPPKGPFQLRVTNTGAKAAFWRDGVDNTIVADVTVDTVVLPGAIEVFTLNSQPGTPVTHIAAICGSGDVTTLYFGVGEGV